MPDTPVVVTAGEILVEFVSHKKNCGLEETANYSGPYPSGAPAIFLDQAARMGAHTEMIGGIGVDGFGRSVLARLTRDGVGIRGVTQSPSLSTGVAFVSYYDDGSRDFVFHITNTAADQFDIPQCLFDPATAWLHVSAASLGNTALREAIMPLVHQVRDAGGKVVCDPNARPELMRDDAVAAALSEVMALSYCLMPSTSDLGFLFPGVSEESAIRQMLDTKAEIIVLKRGADGVTIVNGDQRLDFTGHTVEEVDPTGAGDCFCGTFISLLVQGATLSTAGQQANAAGAIAVTRHGPMEGNSSPEEIARFLRENENNEIEEAIV